MCLFRMNKKKLLLLKEPFEIMLKVKQILKFHLNYGIHIILFVFWNIEQ